MTTDEIVAMLPARYTLAQVTDVMGQALGALPPKERLAAERTLFLYVDDVVRRLKALAEDSKRT